MRRPSIVCGPSCHLILVNLSNETVPQICLMNICGTLHPSVRFLAALVERYSRKIFLVTTKQQNFHEIYCQDSFTPVCTTLFIIQICSTTFILLSLSHIEPQLNVWKGKMIQYTRFHRQVQASVVLSSDGLKIHKVGTYPFNYDIYYIK